MHGDYHYTNLESLCEKQSYHSPASRDKIRGFYANLCRREAAEWMINMIEQNQVSDFVVSITKQAEQQKEKIENETKAFVKRELEKVENDALKESYDYIKREVTKIREDIGRKLSLQLSAHNHKMLIRREEICKEIFLTVKDKILSFTSSKEYPEFLKNSIKNCAQSFSEDALTVFIKNGDTVAQNIIESYSLSYNVISDNKILLGGIKMTDSRGKILIDDTLDSRFNMQKKLFSENSGLIISKI
ncbi:MAG: V-type ATP synthase subunit E [Oscillospiraceae bacterium]